jgi:hypothetical protein
VTLNRCACCEFPNQNPELEAGVIRVKGRLRSCGKPPHSADLVALYGTLPGPQPQLYWDSQDGERRGPSPDPADGDFERALPPAEEALDVDVDTPDAERPADDDFSALLRAMQAVLLAEGATRAAAMLAPLMLLGSADLDAIGDKAPPAGNGPIVSDQGRLRLSEPAEQTRAAWRGVLSGQTEDLAACGTGTLDRWAAELVAALLGAPARADEVRRELRRRGVAAFGMLAAA